MQLLQVTTLFLLFSLCSCEITPGTPIQNVTSSEFITKKGTVSNLPLSNVTSTTQSSQHKTENQSSIKTSEIPDTSPSKTTTVSSSLITTPRYISPQGTEDEKYANPSPTSPSYSSIILPVVIALIVLTLSVFVLVGLYRMFWKTDPGTPENGNDQPQSDKESVKLLTVKTISNESGEHSAQGKSKN
ncbi:endomucin isoform X2 [Marmota flaviventris]|uniref:endomucin isoform X2 n=1 Tax=Marmota flaviventris TaxID=93162 RepID=UPI003A8782FA